MTRIRHPEFADQAYHPRFPKVRGASEFGMSLIEEREYHRAAVPPRRPQLARTPFEPFRTDQSSDDRGVENVLEGCEREECTEIDERANRRRGGDPLRRRAVRCR